MDRNFRRLLDTLSVLQRRDRLTTQQVADALLARGHVASVRTVQRDLESLATAFPLVSDQRSRPFTWGWDPAAPRFSLPGMDWPEAIAFHLLSTYLTELLPAAVRDSLAPFVAEADRRLAARFDELPLRRWPERVRVVPGGPPLQAPPIKRSVHLAVAEAVLLGRCVRVRYQAFGQAASKSYDIAPLGLVQQGSAMYVPARFAGHSDVRTIALHRVARAELRHTSSGIEDFDLSAWIEGGGLGFGGEALIDLVLRLFDGAGQLLVETPLADGQTVTPEAEGTDVVRASVRDTEQLRRWLLSLGARAEVVAPEGVRTWIAEQTRTAAARYGAVVTAARPARRPRPARP